MPDRRPATPIATLILVAAAFLAGCKPPPNAYVPPPPPEVTVATPERRDMPDLFETTGTIRAFERVEVRARVRGFIAEKLVLGGERVKKGDLLFVIDPRPFEASVKQAQAEVASRESAVKLAEITLARVDEAVKASAVSKLELDKATADRDGTKAQLELAQAALVTAKLNLEYTRVVAPMNGRVGIKVPDKGQLVSETELLTDLSNTEQVYANFTMDEKTLRRTRERNNNRRPGEDGRGELKVLLGYPDTDTYPYEGRFARADAGVDASTGTITIEAVFDNPTDKLLPGNFVRVASVLGDRTAMLIPDAAIQADQAGRYVFIVNASNKVERRNVTTGSRAQKLREVLTGLEPTDRVVVNGVQRCRPGSEVKPSDAAAPAPTPAPASAAPSAPAKPAG